MASLKTFENASLTLLDLCVIVLYFGVVLSVGLWTSRKNRGSVGGYFLAGRNMHWILLGSSLFASNVGSLHFVGLAGSGAEAGIGIAVYELNAVYVLLMLGWLFVPVYVASGIYTVPEYMKLRFGGERIQVYLAVLSLLMYVFTKISADLFAGAIFIEQALGFNMYIAVGILLGIAAIFTITGGLTAVIWTDFIQTCIMVVGAAVLMCLGLQEVGGFSKIYDKYPVAVSNTTRYSNDTCGYPRDDYYKLMRDPVTGDIPWPGIVGLTLNSIWYWCADQVIVQRTLAGKTYSHSKAGCVLCGGLKLLPLFIIVFPGMIARVLYPDEVACVDPDVCMEVCGSANGCSNIAYPMLVLRIMPSGARGVMLAVMLSALMSSLTSIFNSSSTIFTIDIWCKFRQQARDVELLVVGRVCVLVLVVISIAWIPIVQASQGSQLFVYIMTVSSFLQPPICAVYLLAIFWQRTNEKGAFWALMSGLLVGAVRFVLEFLYQPPSCWSSQSDTRPPIIKHFHYLYFAIFLFLWTVVVCVVISLCTKPLPEQHLYRLTFWTRNDAANKEMHTPSTGATDDDSDAEVTTSLNKSAERHDTDITSQFTEEKVAADDLKQENSRAAVPCFRRAIYWICGVDKYLSTTKSTSSNAQARAPASGHSQALRVTVDISENSRWRHCTNAVAIVLMIVTAYIWGLFS